MTSKEFYQNLGTKVRELRHAKKLTIAQLAEVASIDDYFLGEIERAEKKPSLDTLLKLAKALDTEVYLLLKSD